MRNKTQLRRGFAHRLENLKNNRIQWVGVYVGKERRILCNALPPEREGNDFWTVHYTGWRRRFIRVHGDVPGAWSIRYDPDRRECSLYRWSGF